ncbi:MAG: alanine racemase [Paracoccus sp. (in: a-proteobacteria)]|nr:alanine racemase [Paracoccus sp. (in: a-proteobacteria)]
MSDRDHDLLATSVAALDLDRLETPFYVYASDLLAGRAARLVACFDGLFTPSYAIKSNPNLEVLRIVMSQLNHIDASSAFEVERALAIGLAPEQISWSGPGKREAELRRLAGRGINIVVESLDEVEMLASVCAAQGVRQDVLLRINPDHVPKGFGASMSGKPSQFGIDEPQLPDAIRAIEAQDALRLTGFHAYTGSMCLSPEPIAENVANLCAIFARAADLASNPPEKLIFGAGFGISLHEGQEPLDIDRVRELVAPHIDALAGNPRLAGAERLLEIGRWISGPSGALVARVLSAKTSRGLPIAVCDAGFNNHLAACGMMGSVFQKNYPFRVLRHQGDDAPVDQMLAGPLCTSIDQLARKIALPLLAKGDVLAVLMSGAYGLTASPTRFISHPEPAEYVLENGQLRDVSESALNHPGSIGAARRESRHDASA